ncbi:MAG: sugar phosphate isomerase/epimerase [Defluviitaleaceae bacterium]|nr:sugar phosphate isomerase/epimerase [Defluviitaleaceae bacterium]
MSKPFVSLQLYTVRDFAEKDVGATLAEVKGMGYDYVELAGIYGMGFAEFRGLLDKIGLSAISAHVQFSELEGNLAATISSYKSLGCEYIIIPMMDNELLAGGNNFKKEVLEDFCAACKAAGVTAAYHNHAHEFAKLKDGTFVLDKLFELLPDLETQLDTGWVKAAGQNPEAYIKKYAGRCPIIHIKDTIINSYNGYEDRPVGKGSQNIPATIEAALSAGVKGFVVELDKAVGQTSLEAAKESREYLKSLGY